MTGETPTVRGLFKLDASPVEDAKREALAWELARVIASATTPWGTWDGDAGYHLRRSSKAAADAVLARLGDTEPEQVRAQRVRADVAEALADKRGNYAAAYGRALTELVDRYGTQATRALKGTQERADVDEFGDDARYLAGVTEGLRIARRVWVHGPAEPEQR